MLHAREDEKLAHISVSELVGKRVYFKMYFKQIEYCDLDVVQLILKLSYYQLFEKVPALS
jgi:hypothetical protein